MITVAKLMVIYLLSFWAGCLILIHLYLYFNMKYEEYQEKKNSKNNEPKQKRIGFNI